ncbi:tetratricopeptide repeat protein [Luteolibacter luteus]|uniref:Tetratricopeptide repeat protein n=1 Tax=Luteolibacter luteus TaxID=2728835 RepID=A0A858RL91_9BACT|nr:tetratricopeptide repeat protein [Luteolibacter luteus]QJE97228.1 hypothetical protein HHL09_16005 [Luteolibacter luteus]
MPNSRPGPTSRPDIVNRPRLTPGINPNPVTRPGIGTGTGGRPFNLTPVNPSNGGRAENVVNRQRQFQRNTLRPGGGIAKISRPIMRRPTERFLPGTAANIRSRPGWRNQWGNWGNWPSRRMMAGVATTRGFDATSIGRNYRRCLNWSYRPNYWGCRPWWASTACHSWHYGSWNYCWTPYWYRNNCWYYPRPWPGYSTYYYRPVSWGLVCWGLGSLAYDSGYYTYENPYTPEPYTYGDTVIRYEQPMSVTAAEYPTGDEAASDLAATRSAEALDRSRDSFLREDYLAALKEVDEAISYQPGDSAQHEYRALVLFALGKYDDAAGVLNPILASGPGWDRRTMIGLYRTEGAYLDQLAKLEAYVQASPGRPAPRFLLGYHYLVNGRLSDAEREFGEVTRLQPSDSIARQLRDLAKSSTTEDVEKQVDGTAPEAADSPAVESLSAGQLVGTWTSNRGENGTVVLSLREDGSFSWIYTHGEKKTDLSGTYEIDDRGLLVLSSEDAQMVGRATLPEAKKLTFVLEGGPEGDPGISFVQTP